MVQGRGVNAPLNDLGRSQAKKFYEAYSAVAFDKIYTSNLIRTIQSVQGFIDDGIPYESLEGLDEISWGSHEGQPFNKENHQHYLTVMNEWKSNNLEVTVGDGESPLDVMNRQKGAMEHILSKKDEETILISTHGRAMRILLCWLFTYPLCKMDIFEHQNLCLYQISHAGSMFSMQKFNDTAHLNHH